MQLVSITLEQCLNIRHTVLWPHLARNASRVEGDDDARHFGVLESGQVVSCLSVFMLDERRCQIRKFATLQTHQQQGYGRFLLQSVLETLVQAGVEFVQLDARTSAAVFYARFGFIAQGEPFYKKEVQYIRMSRGL
ncbi:GNAT family N-acetyltransferase [Kosakonia pseudosacchari]|uniref:GNAT family N-acetyltransferase n=1 Tax=Kosakonia pseudosacchari TaxID=1646340 RepID=UPI0022EFD9C2|nr:GNAT family N-acetyltransferase [Kosakonia pseudosacchari]WBU49565.1 GNAT family N-acetyltransferase [Kosakonia pseudosacchari]